MKIVSVVVTGTNRGLGLQFVKDFLHLPTPPTHVIATCRQTSQELGQLASEHQNLNVLELDVRDDSQHTRFINKVQSIVGNHGVNLLINNAGIFDKTIPSLTQITKDSLMSHYEVNVVAPILLTKAMLPLLRQAVTTAKQSAELTTTAAAVLNLSAVIGCTTNTNHLPHGVPYRLSKAALNKATHCLAFELEAEGIVVGAVHPGWVRTDMGTKAAPMTVEDSVGQIMKNIILKLEPQMSGKLLMYSGTKIAW